jgi:hypothetical protein
MIVTTHKKRDLGERTDPDLVENSRKPADGITVQKSHHIDPISTIPPTSTSRQAAGLQGTTPRFACTDRFAHNSIQTADGPARR